MIEINISDWIAKLGRLDASTHEESDQDGWTMEHVLYQSAPRLRGGRRETKPATTFKTPTSIIWPQSWRTAGTSGKVSLDGLKASLEDSFKIPFDLGTVSPEYAICLRADFPFPPRLLGPSYFEVTIDTEMDGNEPTTPAHSGLSSESEPIVNISVGLCGEFLNRKRSLPGWELWSIGYHGGDGKIFEGRFMSRPRVFGTGHRFGPGQTIGCGVDYERKIYFFTVDGVVIADRHINDIIFRKLYPCIGHAGSKAKVVANFGGSPFAWHDAQKLSPEPFKMRKSTTWDRSEM
ncbi:hypothetical protein F5Y10DRAFT_238620 [Nemania abortiva]|nr:hypothetical protein F5Y10DRAFT_238620 [Nemania abortiva]